MRISFRPASKPPYASPRRLPRGSRDSVPPPAASVKIASSESVETSTDRVAVFGSPSGAYASIVMAPQPTRDHARREVGPFCNGVRALMIMDRPNVLPVVIACLAAVAPALVACMDISTGTGNGGGGSSGSDAAAAVTPEGGVVTTPAVTGTNCGVDTNLGIQLCASTTQCPNVVIDQSVFSRLRLARHQRHRGPAVRLQRHDVPHRHPVVMRRRRNAALHADTRHRLSGRGRWSLHDSRRRWRGHRLFRWRRQLRSELRGGIATGMPAA